MNNPAHNPPRQNGVALVRWSKNPGEDPFTKFVLFCLMGLILCLALMIFMPVLRSFGGLVLFMVVFPAIFTVPTLTSRRTFLRGLTKRVNEAIVEVTGSPGDQLSVKDFRRMIRSGERLPLLVSGVSGLHLHVERAPKLAANAPESWRAVFTVVPPEHGTASFDRLVAAAMNARG